jgi:hypothetical protein
VLQQSVGALVCHGATAVDGFVGCRGCPLRWLDMIALKFSCKLCTVALALSC